MLGAMSAKSNPSANITRLAIALPSFPVDLTMTAREHGQNCGAPITPLADLR
jgi:hypothetical protein